MKLRFPVSLLVNAQKKLKGVATPKIIKETLENKLQALSIKAADNKKEEETVNVTVTDTSKLTKYNNPNAYKPAENGAFKMLAGDVYPRIQPR